MNEFIAFTVVGVVTGATYAIAASGLVVTYATSGIFNIAHGAIGMLMAFVYWQFRVAWDWPAPLALAIVILVIAPLFGALVERFLIRRVQHAAVATTLVVTIGLMVGLIGLVETIWKPESRELEPFFGHAGFHAGSIFITWSQVVTVGVAAGIAVGLRLLLYRTRTGISMRAVVDNRGLAGLNGARPQRISTLSWGLGSMLAAIAGILIAPSPPAVGAGADPPGGGRLRRGHGRAPAQPAADLRRAPWASASCRPTPWATCPPAGSGGPPRSRGCAWPSRPSCSSWSCWSCPRTPSRAPAPWSGGTWSGWPRCPDPARRGRAGRGRLGPDRSAVPGNVVNLGTGLALGLIMLSLVPLTGWGGQVSLCQMTFAGLGAFAMARLGHGGSPWGLVAAAVLAGAVGAAVSLPALRLRGLYLALATLAFASAMDDMFFPSSTAFGFDGSVAIPRPRFFGITHGVRPLLRDLPRPPSSRLVAMALLALRRGPFGRVLSAMKDSEAACATLGLNLTTTKLTVFILSAALAGVAGALYGAMESVAGSIDFMMLQSLPILLLAVVGGVATAGGALFGGLSLGLLPLLSNVFPGLEGITLLGSGLAGITLGSNPDGIVPALYARLHRLTRGLAGVATPTAQVPATAAGTRAGAGAGAAPGGHRGGSRRVNTPRYARPDPPPTGRSRRRWALVGAAAAVAVAVAASTLALGSGHPVAAAEGGGRAADRGHRGIGLGGRRRPGRPVDHRRRHRPARPHRPGHRVHHRAARSPPRPAHCGGGGRRSGVGGQHADRHRRGCRPAARGPSRRPRPSRPARSAWPPTEVTCGWPACSPAP